MKNILSQAIFTVVFLFVVLFDKDSIQLGTTLIEAPDWVITTASIFGNVFWLFGLLIFVVAGILFWIAIDDEQLNKTYTQLKEKNKLKAVNTKRPIARTIAAIVAVFAVGSGFWFTGTSMLVFQLGYIVYADAVKKKMAADDDIPTPEKDLSANDLLDD